jgi:hypothetical protein
MSWLQASNNSEVMSPRERRHGRHIMCEFSFEITWFDLHEFLSAQWIAPSDEKLVRFTQAGLAGKSPSDL